MYAPRPSAQGELRSWHYVRMGRGAPTTRRRDEAQAARVRRGYFECRYGQLHVHNAMPPGGGFEEDTPLLCLHDVCGSAWVFTRFLAFAGQDRSVYAPDLPGFGESDPPTAQPSIADYAAALGDFLDSMRLRHFDVLGYRAGAVLATELAVARPVQIGRVVMVSVPLLTENERQAAARVTPAPGPDSAFRSPDWQRWGAEAAAQYPLRERLARLRQRLLVLRPRDELWEASARVREAQPSARLCDLEASGPELFGTDPGRVAEAVREFLRG
jgi:pimeloyl-ACP methyl ester carboxylesterase